MSNAEKKWTEVGSEVLTTIRIQEYLDLKKQIVHLTEHAKWLEEALELPLLFHGLGWSPEDAARWKEITGQREATTKVMCNHIRAAIASKDKP